jgi:hypothetical protein
MPYRRTAVLLAALAAASSLAPTPAQAAESPVPTAQQKAYGLDWAPFIDPADLPPVEQRKIVCLVDSGVAVTPDLPADRPEGPIVARLATDGGSGLPGPAAEHQHGTRMASYAGAVAGNDWGTVGAWPGVRIISVRAMSYDRTTFLGAEWRQGLVLCQTNKDQGAPIAVVNFSLGGDATLTASERTRLAEAVKGAHDFDNANVVAAAGNRSQPRLDDPANVTGVLPIAAGDTTGGGLCSYASYVPGVLVGPGCGMDAEWDGLPAVTDGGGSSSATAIASTTVALLRTLYLKKHGIEASWQDAERWLRDSAITVSGRPVFNGDLAARLAGLGDVVDRRARRGRHAAADRARAVGA